MRQEYQKEMMKKKLKLKKKWKVIFSFLGIIIVAAAVIGFEFYQLQPKNHFKTVPVVGSATTTGNQGNTQTAPNDTSFNILIMGSDEQTGETIGHSDSMMLAHVDLSKNQINAISIPRDTRIYLDGYGYTKLTSAQYIMQANYGTKQGIIDAVKVISNLTGVPINYYVETNFNGFKAMIDSLGGVHMTVPTKVKLWNKWIEPGNYLFDGNAALALARERHSLADGDYGRQQEQFEIIKAIGETALSPSNIPKLPALVKSLSSYLIATNMSTSDMISLGLAEKNFNPNTQLHYQQIPETPESLYDDILKANNDELVVNQQQMKALISKYFQS